ncbi:MAG: deoxyribose-phosphate aldolase [bacterium]|nr:deoxyribose-phosphate aldolase [bacterium]
MTPTELARRIQHTLLKITATRDDILSLCREARTYNFQAVCVQPIWVPLAVNSLRDSDTVVCSVADFPHGASTIPAVTAEVQELLRSGAREVDVVCKIGYLRSGMYTAFRDHLAAVATAANGAITKVILEAALLTDDELATAIDLAAQAGIHYIKTASGFNGPGASVELVSRMHQLAAGRLKIKAAGGIRTKADAEAMLAAGADCLGTSSGVAIVTGAETSAPY